MAFVEIDQIWHWQQGTHRRALSEWTAQRSEPFYLYDLADVRERLKAYRSAFHRPVSLRYAMKANANREILKVVAELNGGVDVVSGGELEQALQCGIRPENIVFSGVAKSEEELKLAFQVGIGQINVESLSEIRRICRLVKISALMRPISIALRINPEVEVSTHKHITTGSNLNKFGLDKGLLSQILQMLGEEKERVNLVGLAVHVGSQIFAHQSILTGVKVILEMAQDLQKLGWPISRLDIGGGLGIDYHKRDLAQDFAQLKSFASGMSDALKDFNGEVLVEPGRFIVARAGVLLGRVECLKETSAKRFAILNTGIHHLIRPALYEAHHEIVQIHRAKRNVKALYDIVGPLCESSDVLGEARDLYSPEEGEWLAILDAGAYGYTMANQYNLRKLPEEVIIND